MFARTDGLKQVNEAYLMARVEARREAFSLAEFGDPEITQFDLETAGVTGKDNPESYTTDRPLSDKRVDVRELPRH